MLRHELTLKVPRGVWAPCGEFIEVDEGYIGVILKPQKNTTKTTKTVKPRLKETKTESKENADKRKKKIGSVVCQIQLWFSRKLMGVLMKIIWNFAT